MSARTVLGFSLLLILCATGARSATWDVYDDFSSVQNPNGPWAFGWRSSPADPFVAYTDTTILSWCTPDPGVDCWNYRWNPLSLIVSRNDRDQLWSCNGCDVPPRTFWFHPGPTQQCVVRWVAPQSGPVEVAAHFRAFDADGGSSVVRVYHGGGELWSAVLDGYGATADCSLAVPCVAGDAVDVAIDAITFYNDSVALELRVALLGACCLPGGECQVDTEWDCAQAEGEYAGDGVSCVPNPCEPTLSEAASWGRIKSTFR